MSKSFVNTKSILFFLFSFYFLFIVTCNPSGDDPVIDVINLPTSSYFPFEHIGNWWMLSEEKGNLLRISVNDTISDDNVQYYKLTFEEQNLDTTTDWFKKTPTGIEYSTTLINSSYELFLPAMLKYQSGSFANNSGTVNYQYLDSKVINNKTFDKTIQLDYDVTIVHSFDVIFLSDSIGIVGMVDSTGRFPVIYELDSALIKGTLFRY